VVGLAVTSAVAFVLARLARLGRSVRQSIPPCWRKGIWPFRSSSDRIGTVSREACAQRKRTMVQIEGFRRALAKVAEEKPGKRSAAIRASYGSMIRQLEDELRIAKGVSQSELARRLGVSKQVISRYEESAYQTVAIARLQEILDAIWDQDSRDAERV